MLNEEKSQRNSDYSLYVFPGEMPISVARAIFIMGASTPAVKIPLTKRKNGSFKGEGIVRYSVSIPAWAALLSDTHLTISEVLKEDNAINNDGVYVGCKELLKGSILSIPRLLVNPV